MPLFNVTVVDPETSEEGLVTIPARTVEEAHRKAIAAGWVVAMPDANATVPPPPSRSLTPVPFPHGPGWQLARVADRCALCSLLFVPLAFFAIVLGAVALEKSSGRYGRGPVVFGLGVVVVWACIIVFVLGVSGGE